MQALSRRFRRIAGFAHDVLLVVWVVAELVDLLRQLLDSLK